MVNIFMYICIYLFIYLCVYVFIYVFANYLELDTICRLHFEMYFPEDLLS
jgi:hypothetical protein